jgi:hypothetical protein
MEQVSGIFEKRYFLKGGPCHDEQAVVLMVVVNNHIHLIIFNFTD